MQASVLKNRSSVHLEAEHDGDVESLEQLVRCFRIRGFGRDAITQRLGWIELALVPLKFEQQQDGAPQS